MHEVLLMSGPVLEAAKHSRFLSKPLSKQELPSSTHSSRDTHQDTGRVGLLLMLWK